MSNYRLGDKAIRHAATDLAHTPFHNRNTRVGHNYIGPYYIGHNYIGDTRFDNHNTRGSSVVVSGHNCHNCIGHNYIVSGHNCHRCWSMLQRVHLECAPRIQRHPHRRARCSRVCAAAGVYRDLWRVVFTRDWALVTQRHNVPYKVLGCLGPKAQCPVQGIGLFGTPWLCFSGAMCRRVP